MQFLVILSLCLMHGASLFVHSCLNFQSCHNSVCFGQLKLHGNVEEFCELRADLLTKATAAPYSAREELNVKEQLMIDST